MNEALRIAVTGGKGTLGAPLCAELRRRGHEVLAIGRSRSEDEHSFHESVRNAGDRMPRYARADVANYRQLERVILRLGRFDVVYHAAAEFGRWNGEDFYEQLWLTNVVGTKNVLRLQEQHRFRLVHFSSSEVYGDWLGDMAEEVMDLHEVRQLNDYAATKWVNEQQVRLSAAAHGAESVVVRPFNCYGPGERYSPYRSVNCRFLYCALMGLPWTVRRGHRRTSLYVDDAVRTLANLVDPGRFKPGSTYNLASIEEHTIERLSELVKGMTGADGEVCVDPEPFTAVRKRPVIARAAADLGHRCEWSLEDGMAATCEWMVKEYMR